MEGPEPSMATGGHQGRLSERDLQGGREDQRGPRPTPGEFRVGGQPAAQS